MTIVALGIIVFSAVAFIVLYFIKAFQDPNFCRSEKHVEYLQKMFLEQLGSDTEQFDAQVVELELERESVKDKRSLTSSRREEGH